MRQKIDCFLPDFDRDMMASTVSQLNESQIVRCIFWTNGMTSSNAVMTIAERARAEYVLLFTKPTPVTLGQGALERMLRVADDSGAASSTPTVREQWASRHRLPAGSHSRRFRLRFAAGLSDTRLLHTFCHAGRRARLPVRRTLRPAPVPQPRRPVVAPERDALHRAGSPTPEPPASSSSTM